MATVAWADNHAGRGAIVEPGEQFLGQSYNQLVSEWNTWLTLEPIATNPAFDTDGRFCDKNQSGKVWFLASTFEGIATRTCQVPAGKAIFVSLGGAFIGFKPEFPAPNDPCLQAGTDLAQVRCDVNDDVPLAPDISIEVILDGVAVKDIFAFRAQSEPGGFTLRIRPNSLLADLGFPPGMRSPVVADGYYLLLRPLKPGEHTLRFVMTIAADGSQTGVNYTLIIPSHH
jgi:hypothetical protein